MAVTEAHFPSRKNSQLKIALLNLVKQTVRDISSCKIVRAALNGPVVRASESGKEKPERGAGIFLRGDVRHVCAKLPQRVQHGGTGKAGHARQFRQVICL